MIKEQAKAVVPTDFGTFEFAAYSENENDRMPEIVLNTENLDTEKPVNLRIHSECITGDVFHSQKCDCGDQLMASLEYISKNGGMLIYHRQEGRNIGIIEKLKAYNLQEQGMDTAEANLALGHEADERTYEDAIEILKQRGITSVNLMTNNPEKVKAFDGSGITVNKRISIEISPNDTNRKYLQTKKDFFGHFLNLK